MKCSTCLHRVPVISENGIHYNCALSEKEALECLVKQKDSYVASPIKKDPEDIKE